MIILFGSAILSAFLDNTPFIIAMCPLVKHIIGEDFSGNLSHPGAQAMIWSLLLGTCLGGNGSLIGSSANIIAAKIGDKSGAPVSFGAFTKIGFPIMLGTVCIAAVYVWIRYFVLALPAK
jgi:Na+/H+ antiporter NhaD/arsenite permease-like protein